MNQPDLWYDSLAGALHATVEALGPKKVAGALWPSMSIDDARRKLLHSLNPERAEKLALEEVEYILTIARAEKVHTTMHYLTQALHYTDVHPISPDDERAALQKAAIDAIKSLEGITKRLERI